jgi:hypothetical protein
MHVTVMLTTLTGVKRHLLKAANSLFFNLQYAYSRLWTYTSVAIDLRNLF